MDESETSFYVIKWLGATNQFVECIPARDMTLDEWRALPIQLQQKGAASGLYDNVPEILQDELPPVVVIQTRDGINEQEASEAGAVLSRRRRKHGE